MEGPTIVSEVCWLQKEDGSIVRRTITVKDSIAKTSETVFPLGTKAPIPNGIQLYPYPAVPTAVTTTIPPPVMVPQPPQQSAPEPTYHKKNCLEQFDHADCFTRLFLMLVCFGILFLVGLVIFWVIIYPILFLTGYIDKVGDWDDNDDEYTSAARSFRPTRFLYAFVWLVLTFIA
jgi:hypothetical protein